MFILGDPYDETKECFVLRPMTCPFQYQVYLNRHHSYRDLPDAPGRDLDAVPQRGFRRDARPHPRASVQISEGHLVLRPTSSRRSFKVCLDLAKYCLGIVGLIESARFRFSRGIPRTNNKYEDDEAVGTRPER